MLAVYVENMNKNELKLVARMTGDNQHGEAREYIAEHFSYLKHFAKLFKLTNKIHSLEGSIPRHIFEYRNELTKDMMKTIKSYSGEKFAEEINACL